MFKKFANRKIVPQTPEVLKQADKIVVIPRRNMTIREAFEEAFLGIGGVPALIEWARSPENRGAFYALCARLIPVQLTGEGGEPLRIEVVHFGRRDLLGSDDALESSADSAVPGRGARSEPRQAAWLEAEPGALDGDGSAAGAAQRRHERLNSG